MKRNRSENVTNTLASYLKKRQYTDTDSFKKTDLKTVESVEEMAFQGIINNECSTTNAVNYSSINRDAATIEQQFTRLKNFISDAVEPYKADLSYILFPVFVHLYLELICNGHKTPAQTFYARHHILFLEVADYKSVVENLANVHTLQDLNKYPNVKIFRENKYTVKLCSEVVAYFTRYLKDNDDTILLQILNLHVEIKIQEADERDADMSPKQSPANTDSDKEIPKMEENEEASSEISLKSLQEAIDKVRNGVPSLPSVCLYTVTNAFQGLSATAVNHDVSLLAGGFENSAINLWSLTSEPLISEPAETDVTRVKLACDWEPKSKNLTDVAEKKILRAHSGTVYGISFVPNAPSVMLSCSEDTTVRAWSLDTHTNVAIYRGHNYPIWDIKSSSLDGYFATGSRDRTAKLWQLDRTYPVRIFAGHSLDVDCVQFHPNGNYLATGSSDKTVRLWSVQDGKMVRMFQGHRGTIFSLAFSPNGKLLASAGEDRRIKIWDLAMGGLIKDLRGHTDTVYSVCFSKDSEAFASAGMDNVLRIWDVRMTEFANTGDGHTSPELLAAFPVKSTNLQLLHYSFNNMLVAVGSQNV